MQVSYHPVYCPCYQFTLLILQERTKKILPKPFEMPPGFVLGFSLVFILLAVFASQLGKMISSNMHYLKIILGIVIILFGLNYMELLHIKFLNKMKVTNTNTQNLNFVKSFAFGILFSVSWTPCIGTFLSSALLLVAKRSRITKRYFSYDNLLDWTRNSIHFISRINGKNKRSF